MAWEVIGDLDIAGGGGGLAVVENPTSVLAAYEATATGYRTVTGAEDTEFLVRAQPSGSDFLRWEWTGPPGLYVLKPILQLIGPEVSSIPIGTYEQTVGLDAVDLDQGDTWTMRVDVTADSHANNSVSVQDRQVVALWPGRQLDATALTPFISAAVATHFKGYWISGLSVDGTWPVAT